MYIMGTVLLLATEAMAEAESEGGFGLNLDILETNIINLAILVGILFYFGRKVVSNILNERRSNIEIAIREAEERAQLSAVALAEAQQKLTESLAEAERIRARAAASAQTAREAILAKAAEDVERLKQAAAGDLNTERERALSQVRQQVVAMALQNVEAQLSSGVDEAAQQTLIDRSIALLGG
jgi:F-type H+-transporting ATPase subunit b